ncbi:MAG: PorT family protein [Bacteroidales bacterium]|nr:PorT family protein [Bacteroidales bacterium]
MKEILDKKLQGGDFIPDGLKLQPQEQEQIWKSVESSLGRRSRRRFYLWSTASVAAAAAIIAALVLRNASDSSSTPFYPEIQPIEKTTPLAVSAEDGEDAHIPVLGITGAAANSPVSRHSVYEDVVPQPSQPSQSQQPQQTQQQQQPQPEQQTQQREQQTQQPQPPTESQPKRSHSTGRVQISDPWGSESSSSGMGSRITLSASSKISGRGKFEDPSNQFFKGIAAKTGQVAAGAPIIVEQISQTRYIVPITATAAINYRISERFSIGTGLSYTYLQSKYRGTINFTPYTIRQGLHYVGIPVNLYFNIAQTPNMNFYVNGGGTVEKGVRAVYNMKSKSGNSTVTSSIKGLQFSVAAGAGAEYRLGKQKDVGIYFEPNAVYYINSKFPASVRTDHPLHFDVEVGVRIHLK